MLEGHRSSAAPSTPETIGVGEGHAATAETPPDRPRCDLQPRLRAPLGPTAATTGCWPDRPTTARDPHGGTRVPSRPWSPGRHRGRDHRRAAWFRSSSRTSARSTRACFEVRPGSERARRTASAPNLAARYLAPSRHVSYFAPLTGQRSKLAETTTSASCSYHAHEPSQWALASSPRFTATITPLSTALLRLSVRMEKRSARSSS